MPDENRRREIAAHQRQYFKPGGRLVISHPEGKSFVHQLRAATDLFIEPLPTRAEFEFLAASLGLEVVDLKDEPKLYLMVARKA